MSPEPLRALDEKGFAPADAAGFESGFYGDWGVAIRLRGGCVNKCVFCHGYREPAESTPPRDVERLLEQPVGTRRLFLYGEVLNHPALLDILDLAKKKGFDRVELQAVGEELADAAFVRKLADRGVSSVSFAVYAAGPLQDRLAGRPGSWELIQRAVSNLAAERRIEVFLHSVLMNANLAELPRLKALADANGWPFWVLPLEPKDEIQGLGRLQCSFGELIESQRDSGLQLLSFPLCVIRKVNPALYASIAASGRNAKTDWGRRVERGVSDLTLGYTKMFRFVQPERCGSCSVRAACPGVFQGYLERFGDGELEPVEAVG
jgi:hypothetical protein